MITREEAIEIIKKEQTYCDFESKGFIAFEMAIESLSAQTCEDCISRKAVLELATPVGTMYADMTEEMISADDVRKLPSVQPIIP